MDEMSDFYKKQHIALQKDIDESEQPFLLRQLGMPKTKISRKLHISLPRLTRLLDNRSAKIAEIHRLHGIAARRDIHWPY